MDSHFMDWAEALHAIRKMDNRLKWKKTTHHATCPRSKDWRCADADASTNRMHVCNYSANAISIFDVFADANAPWEKQISLPLCLYFPLTIRLQNFSCICSFFAHATLLKAGPMFRYILNVITVAGSANANTWWLSFADANAILWTQLWTWTQNSRICTSLAGIAPRRDKARQNSAWHGSAVVSYQRHGSDYSAEFIFPNLPLTFQDKINRFPD